MADATILVSVATQRYRPEKLENVAMRYTETTVLGYAGRSRKPSCGSNNARKLPNA